MRFYKLPILLFLGLFIASCNNDDDSPTPPTPPNEVVVPDTYNFVRDGVSTVSFGGQSTRIKMANELVSAFLDFENATETGMMNMFNHQEGANDFQDAELNASGKNIRSKTAASLDYFSTNSAASEMIRGHFEGWINSQATTVTPNYLNEASQGVPGQVVVGERTRYVNAKGVENNQMFAKSLIGALITDQTLNNYLSTGVLDAGDNAANNDNDTTAEGKPYTTMEHKFDEAYGYVYGGDVTNAEDPNSSESTHNSFLHKYIKKVDSNENFSGISDDIFNAFKTARAAIVAKRYDVRDQQILILKEKISTVVAVRAIHYLQAGKSEIEAGSRPAAFHDLSEGLGFLYSLQFTQNPSTGQPYMTHDEVEAALGQILADDGLWTVSPETLQSICEAIASRFDFSVAEAA